MTIGEAHKQEEIKRTPWFGTEKFTGEDIALLSKRLRKLWMYVLLPALVPLCMLILYFLFSDNEFFKISDSWNYILIFLGFGCYLPGKMIYRYYSEVAEGRRILKQGEKFITKGTVTSKDESIYHSGRSTRRYYTVDSDYGELNINDCFLGKTCHDVFHEISVGSEVWMIHSGDVKSLIDVKVIHPEVKLKTSVFNPSESSEFLIIEKMDLEEKDKRLLFKVCMRQWWAHGIQIIVLAFMAFLVTMIGITGRKDPETNIIVIVFDGAFVLYLFYVSRKYIFDAFANVKEICLTSVRDKLQKHRFGELLNNTPFKNHDRDYFIIFTPLMNFYVPKELFNKMEVGDQLRIETSKRSRVLFDVSLVKKKSL